MSLAELVTFASGLAQSGVRLSVDGERLRCMAGPGVLTDDLCREIERRKPELISLLARLHADDGIEQMGGTAARPDPIPLSSAQRRFWVLDQLFGGEQDPYVEARALRITGPLDARLLEEALRALVERHEILRTTLHDGGPEAPPHQRVEPTMPCELVVRDAPDDRRALTDVVVDVIDELGASPFVLGQGPLFRVVLVRLTATDHLLVSVLHHAIGDGWSLGLFIQETALLYEHLRGGAPGDLPPLRVQYADYAVWEQAWLASDRGQRQLEYWRRLEGMTPVQLPTKPQAAPSSEAVPARHLDLVVPHQVVAELRRTTSSVGASLFMALSAAWRMTIRTLAGPGPISIATDVANRPFEVEGTIGSFTNHVVLVGPVEEHGTLRDALRAERMLVLDGFHHDAAPYDEVVRRAGIRRRQGRTDPFSQVKLVLQNVPPRQVDLADLTLAPVDVVSRFAKGALLTNAIEGENLALHIEYPPDVFEPALVERFAACVERALALLATDLDLSVADLLAELAATSAAVGDRHSADLARNAQLMLRARPRPARDRGDEATP